MDIINNVYLFYNNEITECWDITYNRINIINFYRYNPIYNKDFLENIMNNYEVNKYTDGYFLFTIDFHTNFHHCMTEMIGQLYYYLKLNINKNIKILIKKNKFVIEYLNLLSFINIDLIEILEENKLYYFEKMYVHKNKSKTKNMIKNMLEINNFIKYKEIDESVFYDKIFLFRENNKRNLLNIDEILEIVKRNNFYIYSPENDTLENQIKLISKCKILICELGAGCCNMFFTNPECKIIILSFLKGWGNKYLFYNEGLLNRNMVLLDGKIINGNEHNCSWTIEAKLLSNEIDNN